MGNSGNSPPHDLIADGKLAHFGEHLHQIVGQSLPRSMDRTAGFYPANGGSIPSGDTTFSQTRIMKTAIAHLEAQKQTLLHNAAVFHREGRTQERDTALDDANDITEALMVLESRTPTVVTRVLPETQRPRTVREWLATIPEAEAALRNMLPDNADTHRGSAHQALARAFGWRGSPEGYDFWYTVHERLERESLTPSSENTTLPV